MVVCLHVWFTWQCAQRYSQFSAVIRAIGCIIPWKSWFPINLSVSHGVPAEDTDNIVLGDVSELADMKLRGHPLAATRCVVFMWARGLFIAGRPWAMEPGIPRCLNHDKRLLYKRYKRNSQRYRSCLIPTLIPTLPHSVRAVLVPPVDWAPGWLTCRTAQTFVAKCIQLQMWV